MFSLYSVFSLNLKRFKEKTGVCGPLCLLKDPSMFSFIRYGDNRTSKDGQQKKKKQEERLDFARMLTCYLPASSCF